MRFLWLIALIVFGAAEAATAGLVAVWFMVGSAAAWLSQILGAKLWLQGVVFLVVSALTLAFTRPLAKRLLRHAVTPTNFDRVLQETGRVTETVDNDNSVGAVYIDGKTWSARSETGDVIPLGTMVTAVRMEGVKLYVKEVKS